MTMTHDFLLALHPAPLTDFVLRPPARAEVVVSTLEDGCRWCHHWRVNRRRAAWLADSHRDRSEVFFSVALHDSKAALGIARARRPRTHLSTVAPSAPSAIVLPALWTSLVAVDDGVDVRALAGLLREMPEPSCVVSTGVGLDLYWLLREPWILEAAPAQATAARLVSGFQRTLRRRARQRGFRVDEQDLGQRLRLPGTYDRGFGVPRPVVVEWLGEARYERRDLGLMAYPPARAGALPPARPRLLGDGGGGDRAVRDFVHGLHRLLEPLGGRATAAAILTALERDVDDDYLPLRAALYELFPQLGPGELPSVRSLGCKLHNLRAQDHDGLAVVKGPKSKLGLRWRVEPAGSLVLRS